MRSASRAFCSTMRMLTPMALTFFTLSNTALMRTGDSPAEGSSSISTLGCTASAQAKASIWRWPPLRLPAFFL